MCGIFGLINKNKKEINIDKIIACTELIRHRGPDDEGYMFFDTGNNTLLSFKGKDTDKNLEYLPDVRKYAKTNSDIIFAHRRLSIIDLSVDGHQPMVRNDNVLIYNGEIYNYVEIKDELKSYGFNFKSNSDTEVILAAYEKWGIDCLKKFDGMYAFSLLDTKNRLLYLCRDHAGIKPLYYYNGNDYFIFASEIKPILMFIEKIEYNYKSIVEFFALSLSRYGEKTFLQDIYQVEQGTFININLSNFHIKNNKYWDIRECFKRDHNLSFDESVNILSENFSRVISLQKRSDVKVGTCLSGGIDSSGIVFELSRSGPVESFSYIDLNKEISEEKYIENVVKSTHTHNNKIYLTNISVDLLEKVICFQESPFNSLSILAQYRLFEKASEMGVKVLLDGQGADELFCGYDIYRYFYYYKYFPKSLLVGNKREIISGLIKSKIPRYFWNIYFNKKLKIIKNEYKNPLDMSRMKLNYDSINDLIIDQFTYAQLPVLLHYEDRNSMANSVESRVPYLSRNMFEEYLYDFSKYGISSDGETKYLLKNMLYKKYNSDVFKRKNKINFRVGDYSFFINNKSNIIDIIYGYGDIFDNKEMNLIERRYNYFVTKKSELLCKIVTYCLFNKIFKG